MNIQYQKTLYRIHRQGWKIFINNKLVDDIYIVHNQFTNQNEYMCDSRAMAVIESPLADTDINDVSAYEPSSFLELQEDY